MSICESDAVGLHIERLGGLLGGHGELCWPKFKHTASELWCAISVNIVWPVMQARI